MGKPHATVFRHFKSWDLIFSESTEWLAGQLFEVLSVCFNDKTLSADDRLNMLINKQLGFIARPKGLPRLLFSDRLHIESPALKGVARNIMKRYTQQLATLIDEGIIAGCFKKGIDPFETATIMTALIQGSVMRRSIYDFEFKLEDEAESILKFLSKILCEKQI